MKDFKTSTIILGLLSSFFFAISFLLNRSLALSNKSWIWSASLRYFYMAPILLLIVAAQRKLKPLINEIKKDMVTWVLWSSIGFGAFYALITFSSSYAPSWLIAGTWQITIIAGMLVDPLINRHNPASRKFPLRQLYFSMLILLGVIFLQINQARALPVSSAFLGTFPVMIGAFAYPMGNRKMIGVTAGRLSAYQRMLGMTICSMPFWLVLSLVAVNRNELPDRNQLAQTFLVAISSGVVATTLYFKATDKAARSQQVLASVEATQSGEVVFALLGEVLLLKGSLPDVYGLIGILLLMSGMLLHTLIK